MRHDNATQSIVRLEAQFLVGDSDAAERAMRRLLTVAGAALD
jgi:hypothetical protein